MKILILIFFIIFVFLVYVRFLETTTAFVPSQDFFATPKNHGVNYEDVSIRTEDGVVLHGWWIPALRIPPSTTTVLFLHGNAGNVSHRVDKLADFHLMGVNVLIIDYRGYGASQGMPSEKGLYLDAKAAFDWLRQNSEAVHQQVVVYGESLGGAVAIQLARERPVQGLILDSTFSSAADVAKIVAPFVPSFLLNLKFNSVDKIKDLTMPKLFLHSSKDEIIPFAMGWKLFEVAPMPKEFVEMDGGHNDGYFASKDGFWGAIEKFLKANGWLPS